MDYMFLIVNRRGEAPRDPVQFADMKKYADELVAAGKMRGGAPLVPDDVGARLTLRGGKREVIDGPFAESKEVIGGYFLVDARDPAEALELAKRCPAARSGPIELHVAMRDRIDDPPTGGPRFVLVFLEPDDFDGDPDGSKYREMEKWTDALKRERKYVECAGLAKDPPPRRVEIVGAKASVTDGPFVESKEVVGGFALVTAPNLAAALELAARCPHAGWGRIEVRQVMAVPA